MASQGTVAATLLVHGTSPIAEVVLFVVGIGLVLGVVIFSAWSRRSR